MPRTITTRSRTTTLKAERSDGPLGSSGSDLASGRLLDRALLALTGPVARRIGPEKVARLAAVADQGASGLGNVVALALLGRALPAADFGAVGTMIGLYYILAGFHRSAFVLIFTTSYRTGNSPTEERRENSTWWWLSLAAAVVLAAILGLAAVLVAAAPLALSRIAWTALPLTLAMIVSPPMLAWEFARRWLYKLERADVVAVCSGANFVMQALGAWFVARHEPTALAASLTWVAASVLPVFLALPWLMPVRPSRAVAASLMRENRATAGWFAATNVPYSVYSSASIVVWIGLFMNALATAVFTAARTLTNPAISLVSAIDSIDKPRAARAMAEEGPAGLLRVVRKTRLTIAVVTGLYLSAVALFADHLTAAVFAGAYDGLGTEIRILAAGFFFFGLNLPSETMMIVLRAGRTMLTIRCVAAAVTLCALWIGARHGIPGMTIAFALSQAAILAMFQLTERWVLRHAGIAP